MKKYILNPAYHLRKEGNRVLLYTARPGIDKACPEDFWAFIHPLNAMMLSFLKYALFFFWLSVYFFCYSI